jgi:hypothetical protein
MLTGRVLSHCIQLAVPYAVGVMTNLLPPPFACFASSRRAKIDHADELMQQMTAEHTDKVWIKLSCICNAYLATWLLTHPNPDASGLLQ